MAKSGQLTGDEITSAIGGLTDAMTALADALSNVSSSSSRGSGGSGGPGGPGGNGGANGKNSKDSGFSAFTKSLGKSFSSGSFSVKSFTSSIGKMNAALGTAAVVVYKVAQATIQYNDALNASLSRLEGASTSSSELSRGVRNMSNAFTELFAALGNSKVMALIGKFADFMGEGARGAAAWLRTGNPANDYVPNDSATENYIRGIAGKSGRDVSSLTKGYDALYYAIAGGGMASARTEEGAKAVFERVMQYAEERNVSDEDTLSMLAEYANMISSKSGTSKYSGASLDANIMTAKSIEKYGVPADMLGIEPSTEMAVTALLEQTNMALNDGNAALVTAQRNWRKYGEEINLAKQTLFGFDEVINLEAKVLDSSGDAWSGGYTPKDKESVGGTPAPIVPPGGILPDPNPIAEEIKETAEEIDAVKDLVPDAIKDTAHNIEGVNTLIPGAIDNLVNPIDPSLIPAAIDEVGKEIENSKDTVPIPIDNLGNAIDGVKDAIPVAIDNVADGIEDEKKRVPAAIAIIAKAMENAKKKVPNALKADAKAIADKEKTIPNAVKKLAKAMGTEYVLTLVPNAVKLIAEKGSAEDVVNAIPSAVYSLAACMLSDDVTSAVPNAVLAIAASLLDAAAKIELASKNINTATQGSTATEGSPATSTGGTVTNKTSSRVVNKATKYGQEILDDPSLGAGMSGVQTSGSTIGSTAGNTAGSTTGSTSGLDIPTPVGIPSPDEAGNGQKLSTAERYTDKEGTVWEKGAEFSKDLYNYMAQNYGKLTADTYAQVSSETGWAPVSGTLIKAFKRDQGYQKAEEIIRGIQDNVLIPLTLATFTAPFGTILASEGFAALSAFMPNVIANGTAAAVMGGSAGLKAGLLGAGAGFYGGWVGGSKIADALDAASDTASIIPQYNSYIEDTKKKLGIKFATGGVMTGPTYGLVGEAGKEAVIPLENSVGIDYLAGALREAGAGNSTDVHVTINGQLLEMNDYNVRRLGQKLAAVIDNNKNRSGGV